MQLADRIAIPALIVTSIGVVATLYTVCAKLVAGSESFRRRQYLTVLAHVELIPSIDRASRERRDQSLLPTFNNLHPRGLPSRRRFVFIEETTWPHILNEWIPLDAYGPRQLSDVVD